ncbi:MAG TPA: hypothetical protein VJ066_02445, partial [Candidatus Bathyarchaeia archaeon]|nr:hypothetical protein [Candidatus Bathyarchaeia archaeon]
MTPQFRILIRVWRGNAEKMQPRAFQCLLPNLKNQPPTADSQRRCNNNVSHTSCITQTKNKAI